MKTKKIKPTKIKGLRLITRDGLLIDQYGRILESYINEKGQNDLRPTGRCTYAHH